MRTIAWGVSLAATLVLAISSAASAAVVTASAPGVFQQDLGAGVATFESVSPVNSGGTTTSPGPFSDGPGDWSGVGVIANGTTAGVYAQPLNDSTDYLAVVANPVRTPETLELNSPATMLNLYWGSIDTYKVIQFFLGATLIDTVTGTQTLPLLADGNQTSDLSNRLVTITLASIFDTVVFSSVGQNSFEFDNVSANAVPIPAALPLFAGGVGLLGWLARRKRRAAQALLPA